MFVPFIVRELCVIFFFFRTRSGGGGSEGARCQTSLLVLFSLFSRPQAGGIEHREKCTVYWYRTVVVFRTGNQYANVRNNNNNTTL